MKQKKEETKVRLLRQAAQEFAQNGYAGTNVNTVSVKAGFGKGTIYNYFNNKSDLFLSVFRETLQDVTKEISKAIESIEDPVEKMRVALETDFGYFHQNQKLIIVILRESYSADRENQQHYLEAAAPVFELFSQIILDGVDKGSFSDETDPFYSTLMLIGMCENLILTQYLLGSDEISPKEMAKRVHRTFLFGIQRKSGIEGG